MIKLSLTKDFVQAALIRAIRTGAQVLLSMISVGMTISEIDWKSAISITLVAMFVSILTSIVTGLPETSLDGNFLINDEDPNTTKWTMQYNGDPTSLKSGDIVKFKVTEEKGEL